MQLWRGVNERKCLKWLKGNRLESISWIEMGIRGELRMDLSTDKIKW